MDVSGLLTGRHKGGCAASMWSKRGKLEICRWLFHPMWRNEASVAKDASSDDLPRLQSSEACKCLDADVWKPTIFRALWEVLNASSRV